MDYVLHEARTNSPAPMAVLIVVRRVLQPAVHPFSSRATRLAIVAELADMLGDDIDGLVAELEDLGFV